MTDIDFDELDKAVNSLMSTSDLPKQAAPQSSSEEPSDASVSPEPNVASSHASSSDTEQLHVHVPERTTQTQASTAPAKKRSGRFMDMVHPSADMGKRTVATPVSREGTTITPVAETATPDPIAPTEEPAVVPEAETPTIPDEPVVESTMPDPIDTTAPEIQEKHEIIVMPETVAPAEEEVEVQEPPVAEEPAPSESPFIPDAKVEKRPLGGEQSAEDDENSDAEKPLSTVEFELPETKQVDDESLTPSTPAELNPDVVAVEANEPNAFAHEHEKAPEEKTDDKSSAMHTGAINQQYKEEPSSGDASHTAIYDAANYPNTAPKPAKKKSGWLWVLWIVLLLALGAAGAVALYMMKII